MVGMAMVYRAYSGQITREGSHVERGEASKASVVPGHGSDHQGVPPGRGATGCRSSNIGRRTADSPPLHVHRNEDEIFHILDGEMLFRVADPGCACPCRRHPAGPEGHSAYLPDRLLPPMVRAGRPSFGVGISKASVRSFARPARERSGPPDPSGPPTPEQAEALAEACSRHGIELVGPPLPGRYRE